MLNYSFSTILMTVIASNLLVVLIAVCFRKLEIMVNAGQKLLTILVAFIVVRLVFPFEFLSSIIIILPNVLSQAISWFRCSLFPQPYIYISPWRICEAIWAVGIVIICVRRLCAHVSDKRKIILHCLDITDDEPYASLLEQICAEQHRKNVFRVWQLPNGMILTPMIYGFFRPRILVPEGLVLPENYLRAVLKHETLHHFHHDLWIKGAVRLITITYWWNPASRPLEKKLDVVLEMHVDELLTRSDPQAVLDYLNCLEYIAEWAETINNASGSPEPNSETSPLSLSVLPK